MVFVFSANLWHGSPRSPKTVADVAAHEAGHGFGLQHQSQYDATGTKIAPGTKAPAATSTKAPAKGVADKAAKAEEAPAKIEGMEIVRGAKGFLGLQVTGGNFKLSFYDAKKKPVAPDVVRATLRWNPKYQPGPEFYVLGPGDGKSLTVAKTVRPPYQFKLFISMFKDGVEEPTESFVVDFTQ